MKNINKQEELVSALWDFARELQKSKNKSAASIDKSGYRTKMDMQVMHNAIERIAQNFNLEIQEVQ
jgi:tRNA/tmRNA/rRNA uracil-C5-methylase (TrmA/RlmC/RlmD family)